MRLHAGARAPRTRGVPNRIDDASWPFHHRRESILFLFLAARLAAASISLCVAKLSSQEPRHHLHHQRNRSYGRPVFNGVDCTCGHRPTSSVLLGPGLRRWSQFRAALGATRLSQEASGVHLACDEQRPMSSVKATSLPTTISVRPMPENGTTLLRTMQRLDCWALLATTYLRILHRAATPSQ